MQRSRTVTAAAVIRAVDAVRSRLLVRDALHGVSAAAALVFAVILPIRFAGKAWPATVIVAAAVPAIAIYVALRRTGRTPAAAAKTLEHAHPSFRNVLITAEELLRHPERASERMRLRVVEDAAAQVNAVSPQAAVRLMKAATTAALLVVAASVAVILPDRSVERVAAVVQHLPPMAAGPEPTILIELDPPAYTGLARRRITNPSRLDVLEGTRVRVSVAGSARVSRIRLGDRRLALSASPGGPIADVELTESSHFAVEFESSGDSTPPMTLIAVAVTPDRLPTIALERPARDLMLATASRPVDVKAAATDDIALHAMSLHYTKVSGSGEQFEFLEGELPLAIARHSRQQWQARAQIPIATLGLQPGDSLVYRLTARDGRPGSAGTGSSDTFFIEIAGPGQAALDGVDMPPDQDRFALSQQMIVLKIQRLREREASMARTLVQEETGGIAVEQRSVRANFIFLMGGHVEDEEEEAAHSSEIQEGRLENTARREMSRAVDYMTSAEQSLVAADTGAALRWARLAADALQRAFGRNRYILRTLPVRSRIDLSRRLSGQLDEARGGESDSATAPTDDGRTAAPALLAELLAIAAEVRRDPGSKPVRDRLAAAAERALAIDRRSPDSARIGEQMLQLRRLAGEGGDSAAFGRQLAAVIAALSERARLASPRANAPLHAPDRLHGAWAQERRQQ